MKQDLTVKEIKKREKRLRALGQEKLCDCDFSHDNGQSPITTNVMQEYANHYEEMLKEGTGLFIYGGPGAGKSYAAAEIVNELTDNGYDCMFTSMNNIMTELNTLGLEGRRNLFNQIFSKDLLVLDDLGSEVETPFCNQTFIQIVNTCLFKCIPIIITTPYSEEALIKDGGNEKRVMAITRLLKRNINFTVMMPVERRSQNVQRKQKVEVLVKGVANQQSLPAFAERAEWEEATVQECLPEAIQQTLPLNENSVKEK